MLAMDDMLRLILTDLASNPNEGAFMRAASRRMLEMYKTCPVCGAEFRAKAPHRKICYADECDATKQREYAREWWRRSRG